MPPQRRLLGTWTLPSGNSADAYLTDGQLVLEWDIPPSPSWSAEDLAHYERITFPEILRAVARVTGQTVLGVQT